MLRRVADVPLYFQRFPKSPGGSMQHARDKNGAYEVMAARHFPTAQSDKISGNEGYLIQIARILIRNHFGCAIWQFGF